jgi:hypothetical protein
VPKKHKPIADQGAKSKPQQLEAKKAKPLAQAPARTSYQVTPKSTEYSPEQIIPLDEKDMQDF